MFPVSFTSVHGQSAELLRTLLALSFRIKNDPSRYSAVLKNRTVLQMFVENSTRTRMSFEAAVRKLGGSSIGFSSSGSSVKKGETLLDTARVILQYGVDGIVLRHSSAGAPEWIAHATVRPVINAGDGAREHPTQALLDAFTLAEHWQSKGTANFRGRSVLILGDTLHSRVARSNLHFLAALGARVILCGPATLTIRDRSLFPEFEVVSFPDRILSEVDAVMVLRIQHERQSSGAIPSLREYRHFWGLTRERASALKEDAVILHPGPVNRGVEIDSEVADSPRSLILNQVENGVYVRMAVLARFVGGLEA